MKRYIIKQIFLLGLLSCYLCACNRLGFGGLEKNVQNTEGDEEIEVAENMKAAKIFEESEEELKEESVMKLSLKLENIFPYMGKYVYGITDSKDILIAGKIPTKKTYIYESVAEWTDIVKIAANQDRIIGLKSDGTVIQANTYYTEINNWTDVVDIVGPKGAAESWFFAALKSDGTVVQVGLKGFDKSDWTDIVQIASGAFYVVGLKSNGTVVVASNIDQACCDVSDWNGITKICAAGNTTAGIRADGTAVARGRNGYLQLDDKWTDIVDIACIGTGDQVIGLKRDGTIIRQKSEKPSEEVGCYGASSFSAYSNGGTFTVIAALHPDGTVDCAVTGPVTEKEKLVADVEGWTDIAAVYAGWGYVIGLKFDGTVVGAGEQGGVMKEVNGWKMFSDTKRLAELVSEKQELLDSSAFDLPEDGEEQDNIQTNIENADTYPSAPYLDFMKDKNVYMYGYWEAPDNGYGAIRGEVSDVVDCGNYYELKNQELTQVKQYNTKKEADEEVKVIRNGQVIQLPNGNYCISGDNDMISSEVVYQGSIYINKDVVFQYNDPDNYETIKQTTFADYLNRIEEIGKYGNGNRIGAIIKGIDEKGYVTHLEYALDYFW